jgi:hypothetical protein
VCRRGGPSCAPASRSSTGLHRGALVSQRRGMHEKARTGAVLVLELQVAGDDARAGHEVPGDVEDALGRVVLVDTRGIARLEVEVVIDTLRALRAVSPAETQRKEREVGPTWLLTMAMTEPVAPVMFTHAPHPVAPNHLRASVSKHARMYA